MKKIYTFLFALMVTGLGYSQVSEDFDSFSSGGYGNYNYNNFDINNGLSESSNSRSGKAVRIRNQSNANLEYVGADGNGKDGGVGTITFWYRSWDSSPTAEYVVETSINNGSYNQIGASITTISTSYAKWTHTLDDSSDDIKIRVRRTNGERLIIDDFEITDFSGPTCTAPTTQASAYNTTALGTTSATFNWTDGTGDEVLVVVKEGSAVDTDPTSGTDYTGNTVFGSGDQLGTGNYVVHSESATSSVSITGLTEATTYHVAVYEYNTTDTCYLTPALTGSFTTADITKVQFSSTSASVAESAGTYDLVIEIANEDVAATTFDVVLTSGDAADIDSYTTQSETFPGSSTTAITVTITVTDDAIIETDEVFTFEIQNVAGGNNAAVGTNNTFDLTITNNDFPTIVEFVSSSDATSEGAGTYDLEFSIANEDAAATSFDVVLTGGDGDATDIDGYTTQTVTFPGGTSANQTVTLTITDDTDLETDETLTFEIQNVSGGKSAVAGTTDSFTLTIANNDVAPPIALPYSEDFSDCGTAEWTPYDEAGNDEWICSGGEYAINGFTGTDDTDWLISDFSIDFDAYTSVNIDVTTQEQYGDTTNTPGEFELLYSTDYTGGDPTTATWTALTFDPNNTSSGGSLSTASVTSVDASSITGTAYLAFKYDMNFGGGAEDWRVQNIEIYENIALDADTEVYESMTQIAGNSYYANDITTSATAKDALAFIIQDQGTTDGEPTQVTTMRFVPGPNNTADWSDHIQGITLYDENFVDYSPTTTITDSEIILEFGTPITIADGTTLEFFFGFYLNTTNIVDESIIQFQINETSHGFEADASGSNFADTLLFEDVVGNNFTIDVYVAQLIFSQQPSNTFVNTAMTPDISVAAVDINGNIDTSYNLDIEITSSGTLSGSPLVATPVNGVATFVGVTHTALGTALVLTADDGLYPAITSTPFDIEAIPVAGWQITAEDTAFVIDFDTTVTDVNNGTFDCSGFTDTPASGQLDSDAWEVTGMSDGSLSYGGSQTSGDYAKGSSTGNETSGGFYAFDTGSGNSTLGFQPTGSDFTPGTITLRAQNQTGNTVTTADIAYLIYVYNNENRSTSFDLSYSTDDFTYTDVAALDLTSDASADGSPAWVSNSKSTSLTGLSIADGEYLYLRWSTDDIVGSGSRDEFALDDISINFNPVASTTYTYNGTWSPSDPNGTATANDDIVITSGNATINTNTTANSVTVNAGAGLTVDSGITLTTTNGLVLESISTSYSSLILDGTIAGTVKYNRYVNNNDSVNGNDLISAPLSGQAFNTFIDNNPNIRANPSGPEVLFGGFDNNSSTDPFELWNDTDTTPLTAGKGYRSGITEGEASNLVTFEGTVHTSLVQIPINQGSESTLNLIGNPFPSYLDAQEFLSHNASLLDPSAVVIYGYNDSTDGTSAGDYTIISALLNTSMNIAPGQAFFVSSNTTGGNIEFTTSSSDMRLATGGDDFIAGRNSSVISNLKLNLSNTNANFITDIFFTQYSTQGLDPGYDASLLGGVAPAFALYSHLVEDNTDVPLAVQALGKTDYMDVTIPLGVNANQGEQIIFSINETNLPNTVEVYLDDNITNTSTLLNTGNYTLTPNVDLNGTGRFYLRVTDNSLSISDNSLDHLNIYNNQKDKTVVISGQLAETTTAKLYDIQGRTVSTSLLQNLNSLQTIDVSGLKAGVYVVQLVNGSQNKTQKIIIR